MFFVVVFFSWTILGLKKPIQLPMADHLFTGYSVNEATVILVESYTSCLGCL